MEALLLTAFCVILAVSPAHGQSSYSWSASASSEQKLCVNTLLNSIQSGSSYSYTALSNSLCAACFESSGQCPVAADFFDGHLWWSTPTGFWTCTSGGLTRDVNGDFVTFCQESINSAGLAPLIPVIIGIPAGFLLLFIIAAVVQCVGWVKNTIASSACASKVSQYLWVKVSIPQKSCISGEKKPLEKWVPDRIPGIQLEVYSKDDAKVVAGALSDGLLVYSRPSYSLGSPGIVGFLTGFPMLLARSLGRLIPGGAPSAPDALGNFWRDYAFRMKQTHTVLSIFYVHPLNPSRASTNFMIFLNAALWSYFVNFITGFVGQQLGNTNLGLRAPVDCSGGRRQCDYAAAEAAQGNSLGSSPLAMFIVTFISILLKSPWSWYMSSVLTCWPFCCLANTSGLLYGLRRFGFFFFWRYGLPCSHSPLPHCGRIHIHQHLTGGWQLGNHALWIHIRH